MTPTTGVLSGKLLIVDDQLPNALLLERVLRGAGYSFVTSTQDPLQVCDLHRENRYDLILLDLQMPGFDGFRVLAALKEIEGSDTLSVLVMSGYPGNEQRALDAGASGFVAKPFNTVEVLSQVYRILDARLK